MLRKLWENIKAGALMVWLLVVLICILPFGARVQYKVNKEE